MLNSDDPPEYSANSNRSYKAGYTLGYQQEKDRSLFHEQRIRGTSEFDKGYCKGYNRYINDKIMQLLKGETNQTD